MVRDSRYKLVTYHDTRLGELFDFHTDPAEFHNRWHDPTLTEVRHTDAWCGFPYPVMSEWKYPRPTASTINIDDRPS